MLYDTTLLRSFVAICDCGSFTKASREVNLTQSAVSLHIKRLEEQVGARLILRQSRGVRLTAEGEILLSYARRILALNREAELRLAGERGGVLRFGAPEYFDLRVVSSLLAQFSGRYPDIRVQLELGIGPDISALVDEGELALAIVSHEIGEGDGVPLCREKRVWAGSKTMQLNAAMPAPLALYPAFCRWRQLVLEELDRAGRPWSLVVQSAGTAGILAALDAGLAITVLPAFNLPSQLTTFGTDEGLPALPEFDFVLRSGRTVSAPVKHLAEMIVNFFQLSAALTPEGGTLRQRRARLLLQTGLEP